MKLVRYAFIIPAVLSLLCLSPASSIAQAPYPGYSYTLKGKVTNSPNGYLYQDSFDGINTEYGAFNHPEHLFIAQDQTLYLVDTGNNRIVHMDPNYKLISMIGSGEGEGKLNGPKGVFVTGNGTVYVADTINRRIVLFDKSGTYLKQFGVPQNPLLGDRFVYSPSKLIVDQRGYMLVVSEGSDKGLLQLDPSGQFKGYFGANRVPFSLSRVLIKLFASKAQLAQIAATVPANFSSVFLANDGAIYTATLGERINQIKRLSAAGVDSLNAVAAVDSLTGKKLFGLKGSVIYGDSKLQRKGFNKVRQSFVSLTVNAKGMITILDQILGRVYQYDKNGNLLFIFGGLGEQNGLFVTPRSVAEAADGSIYVVDGGRNRIDRFQATPFADKVHEAAYYFSEGMFEEANQPWHEVLEMNRNYDLAYKAIGKALFKQEKYEEAMDYFQIAGDRIGYSKAFVEYRKDVFRSNFSLIILGVVSLWVIMKFLKVWKVKGYRRKLAGRQSDEHHSQDGSNTKKTD
ncbi:MAG TPA: hypothetical protein VGE40_05190 [Bacilli bacterium]